MAVDLNEPLTLIKSLTGPLELTNALSNSLVGLEGDVGALSNDLKFSTHYRESRGYRGCMVSRGRRGRRGRNEWLLMHRGISRLRR